MLIHLRKDTSISVDAEHRGEVFLRSCEAERAATYVIGSLRSKPLYVFKRICGASYYEIVTNNAARFVNRHIIFAEMNTVGTYAECQFYMVVNDKHCSTTPAFR